MSGLNSISSKPMLKEIHRDALFATIFTFVGIWLLHLVLVNIHFFDPLDGALKDFDLSDILYSKMRTDENQHTAAIVDTNIVLVNIGDLDRGGIANLLNVAGEQQPAVIGLDAYFSKQKNPVTDSLLKEAMAKLPNLVTACSFEYSGEGHGEESSLSQSSPYFTLGDKQGHTNFVVREEQTTVRYYPPSVACTEKMNCDAREIQSFSSKLLQHFNQGKYDKLNKRHHDAEGINYSGKLENFIHFNTEEINDTNPALKILKGKIVIIAYLGNGEKEPSSLEDLHFTPYNPQYAGRSFPDMYGGVIHANILAMALHDKYINPVPKWLLYVITFLLCWVHMYFFLHMYVERHIWFHIAAKSVQLVTSVVIVIITLLLLAKCHIKIDSSVLLVPIILSVDLLYFYEAMVKGLHKWYGHRTYLMKGHH